MTFPLTRWLLTVLNWCKRKGERWKRNCLKSLCFAYPLIGVGFALLRKLELVLLPLNKYIGGRCNRQNLISFCCCFGLPIGCKLLQKLWSLKDVLGGGKQEKKHRPTDRTWRLPNGIPNIGNTCFMNAVIQVLCVTPNFRKQLQRATEQTKDCSLISPLSKTIQSWLPAPPTLIKWPVGQLRRVPSKMYRLLFKVPPTQLDQSLLALVYAVQFESQVPTTLPQAVIDSLTQIDEKFEGNKQQDSYEFYNKVLGELEDLSEEKSRVYATGTDTEKLMKTSPISRLYGGVFCNIYRYNTCEHVDLVFQRFTSIPVQILPTSQNPKHELVRHEDGTDNDHSNMQRNKEEAGMQTQWSPVEQQADIQTSMSSVEQQVDIQTNLSPVEQQADIQTSMSSVEQQVDIQTNLSPVEQKADTQTNTSQVEQKADTQTNTSPVEQKADTQTNTSQVKQKADTQTNTSQVEQKADTQTHTSQVEQKADIQTHTSQIEQKADTQTNMSQVEQKADIQTHTPQVEQKADIQTHTSQVEQKADIQTHTSKVGQKADTQTHTSQVEQKADIQTHTSPVEHKADTQTHTSQVEQKADIQTHTSHVEQKADIQTSVSQVEQKADIQTSMSRVEQKADIQTNLSPKSMSPQKQEDDTTQDSSNQKDRNDQQQGSGDTCSEYTCYTDSRPHCSHSSLKHQPQGTTDLEGGLTLWTDVNKIDELSCKTCGNRDPATYSWSRILLVALPPVLVLQFNRFQRDFDGSLKKMNRRLSYPEYLDAAPFCSSALTFLNDKSGSDTEPDTMYRLYGVVCHVGSIHGGHYTAHVRTTGHREDAMEKKFLSNEWRDPESFVDEILNFWKEMEQHDSKLDEQQLVEVSAPESTNETNDTWYTFNDTMVTECTLETVLGERNAYILMYERVIKQ